MVLGLFWDLGDLIGWFGGLGLVWDALGLCTTVVPWGPLFVTQDNAEPSRQPGQMHGTELVNERRLPILAAHETLLKIFSIGVQVGEKLRAAW